MDDISIPIYKPTLSDTERQYVSQCMDSTWISSKGEFIHLFESNFSKYINIPFASSVTNGTVALHLALLALGIKPGDEVILPTFTYVACVNTVLQVGATPIFVDSLEETLQLDPDDVLKKISPSTKAIMAVHLYGLPCDMNRITAICKKHNLFLLEDCAEAFGTYYHNKHVGTFGDIATFSFFANKTITTGEGGMVVAKQKDLIDKVNHLKNQGVSTTREYWHDTLAFNYRMTNICAAIGVAQLKRAGEILAKKREIAFLYKEYLSNNQHLRILEEQRCTINSFWMCTIILEQAKHRDPLRQLLKNNLIETRPTFYPCHTLPHLMDNSQISKNKFSYPIAQSLSERGINLPSYPDLKHTDVLKICNLILHYFKKL